MAQAIPVNSALLSDSEAEDIFLVGDGIYDAEYRAMQKSVLRLPETLSFTKNTKQQVGGVVFLKHINPCNRVSIT